MRHHQFRQIMKLKKILLLFSRQNNETEKIVAAFVKMTLLKGPNAASWGTKSDQITNSSSRKTNMKPNFPIFLFFLKMGHPRPLFR